jgi:hypothetical protein
MALSLENSNKVWQKVKAALTSGTNSASPGSNPAAYEAFDALRKYLATQKANPDLQFVPFTEAQCDAAGGTAVVDAACKVYGIFIRKENSATDNWFWAYDDATNDGTAGDARVSLPLLVALDQSFYINPAGLDMGTGVVVTQYATDALGAVDGSNGGDGFLVIGAA